MNHPCPPAPTRFSAARRPAPGAEHHVQTAHYSAHGAWLCHTGKVRRVNEDACVIGGQIFGGNRTEPMSIAIPTGPWLVAVSDGIGGHRGGSEASFEVVEALSCCKRVTPLSITEILERTNRHLCERGREDHHLTGMGATIAGIGCGGRGLFAFNVGDSRVYRLDGDDLCQVTRDDSEAEDLVDQGLLQPYDGRRPGFMHALTQAIGGREEVVDIETHIHPLDVEKRTRFLVCSDGLTDMLHTAEIAETLISRRDCAAAAHTLFQQAMHAGGMDNITLAVIEVEKV